MKRLGLAIGIVALAGGAGIGGYHLTALGKESAKSAAQAKPEAPAEAAKDDKSAAWGKTCQATTDGKQTCVVVQNVVVTDNNTKASVRALNVAVGYLLADGKLRMVMTVPLGINLQVGVGFQIDDNQVNTVPVETCIADGCRIVMAIDDSGRDSLVKSKLIHVTYQLATGQKITLPVQLAGFGEALAQLSP